jgi:hypothetical protein
VNVGVDESRHEHRTASVVHRNSGSDIVRLAHRCNPPIADLNRGGTERTVDEHTLTTHDELTHRAVSEPKRRSRFPQTRRR